MKLIEVIFQGKIVDITLKMKSIVLGNVSEYLCYISYILLGHFFYFFNFLFQLSNSKHCSLKIPFTFNIVILGEVYNVSE